MYELIQVGKNSYYMDCPAKVGFYKTGENEVVLIDSGSDKDAGKKVKKILDAQGWSLRAIYNTHSHADHIGGNQYLQAQTGCSIFAPGIEQSFTEHPLLEPIMLYGGSPLPELKNKFLMAKESAAQALTQETLPEGLELIRLPGHCYEMTGFRTSDNVVYLADCLSGAETLEKYQVGYLYDVRLYLETLEMVKTLEADCFVPSHAPHTADIAPLAQLNIDKTKEIAEMIVGLVATESAADGATEGAVDGASGRGKTFEEILTGVFEGFGLTMNVQQYVLIGCTVRSYLSYLKEEGLLDYSFENNRMIWHRA